MRSIMRVLEVNVNCGRGSTGRIVRDLAEGMHARGIECKAAYSSLPLPAGCESYAVRIGSDFDRCVHGVATRLFDAHGLWSRSATRRFLRFVRAYDPDVIHLHNIHGYYMNYPLLFEYLRSSRASVVWTLHDAWPVTGHCAYFDYARCDKWKTACSRCTQIGDYPKSFFCDASHRNHARKKQAFSGVDRLTLVTPSQWLAGVMAGSFLSEYDVRVIPNGIDLSAFSHTEDPDLRRKYGIPEDKRILLGVAGVWDRRKGLDDFLRLSALLPEECVLVLVGLTAGQVRALPDGVVGVERTESVAELAAFYSAATLFLNLTHEDNFPTTNIESLACGTPVLTYRTGGSPEAIDESCGLVVPVGDVQGVADRIRAVLEGITMTRTACERRAALFDRGVMVENYIRLFEELTAGGQQA